MSLLIKNGTIVTATSEFTGDLYIEGETIRQIGFNLKVDADRIVDATGRYILPGGVDEHVHYGSFGGRLFETA
ncbi:MAG: dihydropyrimidinase, partial [Clostridiales bacterium]|nr:dihydropyrimidinase [Clostridiales bacterium]